MILFRGWSRRCESGVECVDGFGVACGSISNWIQPHVSTILETLFLIPFPHLLYCLSELCFGIGGSSFRSEYPSRKEVFRTFQCSMTGFLIFARMSSGGQLARDEETGLMAEIRQPHLTPSTDHRPSPAGAGLSGLQWQIGAQTTPPSHQDMRAGLTQSAATQALRTWTKTTIH